MKQPIRFFAIGLFTASLILLIYYLFDNAPNEASDLTTDELIEEIENEGLRVITEEEYITLTVYKDLANNEENEKDEKEEQQDEENETEKNEDDESNENQDIKTYTVKVKEGMMPEEIAKLLEDNEIVDDAFSFATYLEDNGYSPYVQIDSFKLTSDMSPKEIAEKITKNRKP